MPRYIRRSLETVARKAAREFPAVVLSGPRQSGKTTLLQRLFGSKYLYVSLEPPDMQMSAAVDPRGFLDLHPPPVIFDEIQYAPDLLPYIKEKIDADRSKPGQYLLTGSQNLLLMERVTETLAGRAAILKLLPLSRREIDDRPRSAFPWESNKTPVASRKGSLTTLWDGLLRGAYPELVAHPRRDFTLWHASYVQTYLERDVRTLRQVGDLTQFQSFLRGLAARSAQLLNLTDLARDLGIATNTAKAWLSVLEATYQVVALRPYCANIGKRLVKTPKVYFTDSGTLCHLTGWKNAEHAAQGPMAGAIIETAVVSEVVKTLLHRGIEPQVYFWRTSTGVEVDLLVESNGQLVPIEVKSSATARPAMAASMVAFQKDLGDRAASGYVVYAGANRLPLAEGVTALPLTDL